MLAAYADVIGTLGFLLACFGLGLTWWFRRKEPRHQVTIHKELKRSDRLDQLVPALRSSVTSALQFLEADPRMPLERLAFKEATRLAAVEAAWAEVQPVAGADLVREYDNVRVESEIDRLRLGGQETDLDSLRDKLRHFRQRLDEGAS